MRRGGGVGYDFSRSARRARWCDGTQSRASGPISYMRVFDQSLRDGRVGRRAPRRADGHAALRPSRHRGLHPRQGRRGELTNFNISVGVTDAFMRAVEADGEFELVHKRRRAPRQMADAAYQRADGLWVYRSVRRARRCGTRSCGRPTTTPSRACCSSTASTPTTTSPTARRIEATNPCGEQPLPPTAAAASARST